MGTWKPILPFGDSSLIEHVLETALRSCRKIIIVCGYRWSELYVRFRGRERVEMVFNPRYREGQFTSIQAGAALVETERFFITLGDLPTIERGTYAIVAGQTREDDEVIFPTYRERRGHPVLVSRTLLPALTAAGGYGNARVFLSRFRWRDVPVRDPGILEDIDLPEQYMRLRGGD
jgi:molybdenum cofactor cytidylyltransferase